MPQRSRLEKTMPQKQKRPVNDRAPEILW